MRISHKHKFVFLAYPRTASGSIRLILDPYSDIEGFHISKTSKTEPFHHHMNAVAAKTEFDNRNWDWFSYNSFCVIRNPWARVVSIFKRRREKEKDWLTHHNFRVNLQNILFGLLPEKQAFLLYVLTRSANRGLAQNLNSFIQDDTGRRLVKEILKFENLSTELPIFLQKLGLVNTDRFEKTLKNVSIDPSSHRNFYTPLTYKRVHKLYAYEIQKYNYSF